MRRITVCITKEFVDTILDLKETFRWNSFCHLESNVDPTLSSVKW